MEQFVVSKVAAAAAKKEAAAAAKHLMQTTTEDEPVKANQVTARSKDRRKVKEEGQQLQKHAAMDMAFNPNHGGWPADASIALADKGVKAAKHWAIETFNPNCGSKAAEYLKWTSADVSLI